MRDTDHITLFRGGHEERIEVADIAAAGRTSAREFFRPVRGYAGTGPAPDVRGARVRKSWKLPAPTPRALGAGSLFRGVSSAAQFSQTFRAIMGATPSAYRARWRESDT